ncbi:hypothetical protein [Streptomyces sp. NPDC051364]|uniref:hypothetical protein n=1 Tax=Streptomyces sp. NPDC051364 TaxID=3155799 RepID=UPI003432A9ED
MGSHDTITAEVMANVERVVSLAREGEGSAEALAELVEETNELIGTVKGQGSVKVKKELQGALLDAVKIPAQTRKEPEADTPAATDVVRAQTQDVSEIPDYGPLLSLGIQRVKEAAVDSWEKGRGVGEVQLSLRLNTLDKDLDPDLGGRTHVSKTGSSNLYGAVVAGLPDEGEDEDADAVRAKVKSIQSDASLALRSLVPEYVRGLDIVPNPEDEEATAKFEVERARFHNAAAMFADEKYNDKPFSEKVFDYYEALGKPLPRLTRAEKARNDRAVKARRKAELEAAVEAGDITAEEAEASLNPQPEPAEIRKRAAKKARTTLMDLVEDAKSIEDPKAKEKRLKELAAILTDVRREIRNNMPKDAEDADTDDQE